MGKLTKNIDPEGIRKKQEAARQAELLRRRDALMAKRRAAELLERRDRAMQDRETAKDARQKDLFKTKFAESEAARKRKGK